MGFCKWAVILFVPVVVGIFMASCGCWRSPPAMPNLADGWWGRGPKEDIKSSAIRPFVVNVTEDLLADLRKRIINTRIPESLSGEVNFEYGFHSTYMKEVVDHWLKKYDWRKQEAILNSYPQYKTNIEGIDVHFYHIKPSKQAGKVRSLLLIHGWPGSVWEYHKIIPMLTSAGDVSLELVIPSIPGYGFSEAPHQRGFDLTDAGRVFNKLMARLGHNRYYVHGGDWGALMSRFMGAVHGSNTIGVHFTAAPSPLDHVGANLRLLVASFFPSLVFAPEEMAAYKSIKGVLVHIWKEFGYMHLQATRPDTVAYGLNDSPVGLAAYIIEKFSVWTDPNNLLCPDGCLTKYYTLDELLTNVMIYWVTGSIGSSQRFYKENFGGDDLYITSRLPVKVPTGVATFPNEVVTQCESLVRSHLENVVQYSIMPRGGHFAAMEVPKLLADDIISFIQVVERLPVP